MKTLKLMVLAGAFAASASFAQGFMPWTDVMMMADSSGDGMLTMDEVKKFHGKDHMIGFMPFMVDHFAECDANKDNMVTMFEVKKCTKSMGMTDTETSEMFYKGIGFMPRANQ